MKVKLISAPDDDDVVAPNAIEIIDQLVPINVPINRSNHST